jgi:hypothetical protein
VRRPNHAYASCLYPDYRRTCPKSGPLNCSAALSTD